jgi:DNA-binding ferritin-like protein
MTDVETQYAAELKQADIDHHKPTAGAMTGHILSNLFINNVKLHQTSWYLKGLESVQLKALYQELIEQGRTNYDQLAAILLDENELPPSTVDEYVKYSMLEEDAKNKYLSATDLVDITAHDYATQNMFIDRAIVLAQKETRPAMAVFLTNLRGQNNHAIQTLQAILGKQAWDDLVEIDDEDED